jgi:hypothetical protein
MGLSASDLGCFSGCSGTASCSCIVLRYTTSLYKLLSYINQVALNLTLHQEILPVLPEVQVGFGPSGVETA